MWVRDVLSEAVDLCKVESRGEEAAIKNERENTAETQFGLSFWSYFPLSTIGL